MLKNVTLHFVYIKLMREQCANSKSHALFICTDVRVNTCSKHTNYKFDQKLYDGNDISVIIVFQNLQYELVRYIIFFFSNSFLFAHYRTEEDLSYTIEEEGRLGKR